MELNLRGKVAIVTGGSKGIGRAVAARLVEEGASVLVCARHRETLEAAAKAIQSSGGQGAGQIVGFAADLTRAEDVKAVVAECISRFARVDILVNNAGSARPGSFLALTDEAWFEDWTLKFFGYVRMAREVLPHMSRQKSGFIASIIGTSWLMPSADFMIAGAANAALNHFTKTLGAEAAKHGVRVVGVNPGPILTERLLNVMRVGKPSVYGGPVITDVEQALAQSTPLGRVGRPEEVADLIAFLASDRAAFIHATNITIDGGKNPGLVG
jgi:3-oxoacyl-[acyl-carrier protein] reductase/bacilysin biosynthesis oxidoreductase BacG